MTLGVRSTITPDLLGVLRDRYALDCMGEPRDIGGSSNLNVLLPVPPAPLVARVYAPWTTRDRVEAIQVARTIIAGSLPVPETIRTVEGAAWATVADRIVEVERFVVGEPMDTVPRLTAGMRVLARMHSILGDPNHADGLPHLRTVDVGVAGRRAPYANHLEARDALAATRAAADAMRASRPTEELARMTSLALALAERLVRAEDPPGPRQLVHGDFWDNNILFRGTELVGILDFDFMGERHRSDDLALVCCYALTGSIFGSAPVSDRIAKLERLVDVYDEALDQPLTGAERANLPYAIVRSVLPSFCNLSRVADPVSRARYVTQITAELELSLRLLDDARWQRAFA